MRTLQGPSGFLPILGAIAVLITPSHADAQDSLISDALGPSIASSSPPFYEIHGVVPTLDGDFSRPNTDSLRVQILRSTSIFKDGPAGAERLLQILDILDAKTRSELHERSRRLPVTIRTWTGQDAGGRPGIWKEYVHVTGRTRVTFELQAQRPPALFPAPTKAHESDSPNSSVEILASSGDDHKSTDWYDSAPDFCEYTDIDNVYYSGECATAQEIEDANVLLLSLEAELEDLEEEASEAIDEYCNMIIIEDPEDPEYLEACGGGGIETTPGAAAKSLSGSVMLFAQDEPFESRDGTVESMPAEGPEPRSVDAMCIGDNCLGEALLYVGATLVAHHNVFKFALAVVAAAPPSLALVGPGLLAAGSVALSVGTLIQFTECAAAEDN